MGMSLGGYTTALWTSVAGPDDPGGVDFAVAMIPAVSMARLMWRHGESSPARRAAARAGIDEDLLADAFAVHAPTTRPARLPRERLAVIAGRGDRITPPDHAEELARHWGVEVAWFPGGHLAQVGRGEALRAVRRQLGALDLPGRKLRL
jgi:pimeloyl-ACP methyl ester carboxylesterase